MKQARVDEEYIRRGFSARRLRMTPLSGIYETEQEWILGPIGINKRRPNFRLGWSVRLSSSSHFRKQLFKLQDQRTSRVAAVFHQFDEDLTGKPSMEYFIGWVPKERERDLETWLAFLNGQIQVLIARPAAEARVEGAELSHPSSSARLIKRYANRRLYDMAKAQYVTLAHVAKMVHKGEDVRIIASDDGADLTAAVLKQIVVHNAKASKRGFVGHGIDKRRPREGKR